MKRARLMFFSSACAASALWAAVVFLGQSVRFEYQGIVSDIRAGEVPQNKKLLQRAMQDIENAATTLPCNAGLYSDLGYLAAQRADSELESGELAGEDNDALKGMHDALVASLRCTPRDGKLWFDLAVIDSYRGGYGSAVEAAFLNSARVAPHESWIAQKRLGFAAKFQPLLGDAMKQAVRNDLQVLEHAHPNRLAAVMKEAGAESAEAFYSGFGVKLPEKE